MSNLEERHTVLSRCLVLFVMIWMLAADRRSDANDQVEQPQSTPKARRLEQMRDRAGLAMIRTTPDGSDKQETPVKLRAEPLFRYDDQPRGFRDATLWLWSENERPIAIGKIEDWRDKERGPTWVTCLASLAPQPIEVSWKGGRDWTSKKPGLEFQAIKNGPKPETTDAARLRQFKELSQKFSMSMKVYAGDRQELRLLPRQLHRYSVSTEAVIDAVIFGWTANGTNPDAILVIELRSRDGQNPEWVYSLAPVTADQLWLKLDDQVVQHKAQTIYPSDDTLIFFFEKNSETID